MDAIAKKWQKVGENTMRFALLFFSILIVFFFLVQTTQASEKSSKEVALYFFWGKGCPHCSAEKPFLEKLKQEYPQLRVIEFEVWYSEENQTLFQRFIEAHNVSKPYGVPTTFIGKEYLVGYDADAIMGARIENLVKDCIKLGCPDAGEGIILEPARITPTPTMPGFEALLGILMFSAIYLKRRKW